MPLSPPIPVVDIEAESHLVLGANIGKPDEVTWAFIVRPVGENQSRLLVRLRARNKSGIAKIVELFVIEPAHFVMEQKMMRTIKSLAEDLSESRPKATAASI